MLIRQCQSCGRSMREIELTFPVKIDGVIKEVCNKCYEVKLNESTDLLVEG